MSTGAPLNLPKPKATTNTGQDMIELGNSLQKINDRIKNIEANIGLLRPERQGTHHVTFAGISSGRAYGTLTLPSASRYSVTSIQIVNVGSLSSSDWSVTTSGNTILIIAEHPSISARSAYSANVYLAFS